MRLSKKPIRTSCLNSTHLGVATAKRTSIFVLFCFEAYLLIIPSLAPKYEELGGLYWYNNDFNKLITVAKVDATANDVPDEIQGFPTIKLFPAGEKNKTPIEYTGSRTVEDLANFIRDHGSHKIDGYAAQRANETEADGDNMPGQVPADAEEAEEGSGIAESIKSAASEAAEVVQEAVLDDDDQVNEVHVEL